MNSYGKVFSCKGFAIFVCSILLLTPSMTLGKEIDECEGVFRCGNGKCIHPRLLCDGKDDCYDNTDETSCTVACTTDQFACSSGTQCIDATNRCNNILNCKDGSDEQNCVTSADEETSTTLDGKWAASTSPTSSEGALTTLDIFGIVSGIFVVVVIFLVIVIYYRSRKCRNARTPSERRGSDTGDQITLNPIIINSAEKQKIRDERFKNIYTKHEISFDLFELGSETLGRSMLGKVKNGILPRSFVETAGAEKNVKVAVKTLKMNNKDKNIDGMLALIDRFSPDGHHPHIVYLHGLVRPSCTSNDVFVLLEYCEGGDLRSYIRRNHRSLTYLQLINWALQIATALDYIKRELKIIPASLQLKDVFLKFDSCSSPSCYEAKINIFGLHGQLLDEEGNYLRGSKTNLSLWRWLSPESLSEQKLSESSIVWSFGVLLWELFSKGKKPYDEVEALSAEFVHLVKSNTVELQLPFIPNEFVGCNTLCNLKSNCTNPIPGERITLENILQELHSIKERMEHVTFCERLRDQILFIVSSKRWFTVFALNRERDFPTSEP